MALAKKGGKKKGHPAIYEVVTKGDTISILKDIQGVAFKKCAPQTHKSGNLPLRIWELQMCTMTPGPTKLSGPMGRGTFQTISRCDCPENVTRRLDSPNELYALVTYVPVTNFKNLQAVTVDET
ncbi:Hypothetical predicted protein [Lynx pardinus]|uniref:Uncharacterized protein n=1 Tax=Lynx pardinus TaxID=191816 RepID=A0A485PKY4_LYNPA|nr:Hypothetical predicted protein [Lynx pardinus]